MTHKTLSVLSIIFCLITSSQAQTSYTRYVDPFIGVYGGGNTLPGPTMPLGMVKSGPDCGKKNSNNGYDGGGNIHGFSHIHGSGLGGGCKYGNVLFAPIVGEINLKDYSSPRENEHTELGEYSVELAKYNTHARLTTLNKSAMHEYTFPESNESRIIVDLGSYLSSNWTGNLEEENQQLVGSEIRILSATEIEGYTRVRGGWNIGAAYTVYFHAVFDTPSVGRGGLPDYNTKGYVSTKFERSGTRTMEYGNCDLAVATIAEGLGKDKALVDKYMSRAKNNWRNLWNPDIESFEHKGFIWPKDGNGQWLSQAEFSVTKGGGWFDVFYETNSWELSMYVPQDVKGLIEICGGREEFVKRLDTYFTHEGGKLYQVENEPSFLMPCLYNYAGRPDKTAEISRRILSTRYNDSKHGIPDNDDSGSMSAWYVFHALGFYPNAGQDIYLTSSPTFEEVVIDLENGKQIKITARNASDKNIYIQSAKINGKPLEVSYFRHSDIADGGTLEFVMGNKPSKWAQTEIK